MEILTTVDLKKTFGTGPTAVEAVKCTNLAIRQGEFVAITGPSGSGKSTFLHLLGGLDKPTGGKVILEGKDIYSLPEKELAVLRRRKFGFVFQSYNLIPVLSVEENITLPQILDNKPIDQAYIDDLLSLLGLADRRKHLPNALSGGQQQRVAIGRALANKPSIVFADEPTGNLDTRTSKDILDLLHLSAKKYHQTMVMITHDISIAANSERIIRIEDGKVASDKVVQ